MSSTRIVIVGAGLSGLYAAYLLEQANISDYLILEGRSRLGGRVCSVRGVDLGAAWIWPELNPVLMQLVERLQLPYFAQYETGDVLFERQQRMPPMRRPKPFWSTPSVRLQGGMSSLIEALRQQIPATKIITDQQVFSVAQQIDHSIQIDTKNAVGAISSYQAQHMLLAMPPRLVAQQIQFSPTLPPSLQTAWTNTATWMAPHAKYIAVYPTAFWQAQGLSGHASSQVGPMGELHDASLPGGQAALFGFIGVPYSVRQQVTDTELITHCRAQMLRLFGAPAATALFDRIQDWAAEPLTASITDWQNPAAAHSHAPPNTPSDSHWQGHLIGIGSEWSNEFAGYLAGAIDAASVGVRQLIDQV